MTSVAPSASARRSARHSGDGPSPSSPSDPALEAMAFSLLRQTVLEAEFKSINDPNNKGLTQVWIREGKDVEEDEEGVDWIREADFSVEKYSSFWEKEMADHEEDILDWADRLPAAAWAHIPEERQPVVDEEEEEVEVAKVSPENKRKKAASKPTKARKKRKTKKTEEELEDEDTDDGLDGTPLLKLRDEWFALLNSGHALIGQDKVKKSDNKSISKMKARADASIAAFTLNLMQDPEVEEFRVQKMDPFVQRIRKAINAEIHERAMDVMKEYFESFRLGGVTLKSEMGGAEPAAEEDDVVEEAAEKEGEAGTSDEEGAAGEEEAANNDDTEAEDLPEAEVDVEE